ncbi:MAG: hypothetical protein H0U49_07325 [Parachlamydiaceae bacterium]|nr:hypothetical protein [Parachlamydiaceae bacterium]
MNVISIENNNTQAHHDEFYEIASLKTTNKICLTELEDTYDNTGWCGGSRLGRNILRVATAAILSACGTWYAGFAPTPRGIIFGGLLSGTGNGVSTWISWETKKKHFMEVRMMTDFPKVVAKVETLNERTLCLNEAMNIAENAIEFNNTKANLERTEQESCIKRVQDSISCFFHHRYLPNFMRLLAAGGFSGAGGWLGGFVTSPGGIVGGGILSGIGNALSTSLAYEHTDDAEIRKRAFKELPKLLIDVEESEAKLLAVIERIITLQPNLLIKFKEHSSLPVLKKDCYEDTDRFFWEKSFRNVCYVNIAGWMSFGGGLISGFYSKTPGIILGGAVSAFANAISTRLAWEKKNDQKVERIAMEDFPIVVKKVADIFQKITSLETFVDRLEKENEQTKASSLTSMNNQM